MESWGHALDNEGSLLFSEYGVEVNAFSGFDKNMIIAPSYYEDINEGADFMELWTHNNNNSNIDNNFTSKTILSNDNNNNNNNNNNNDNVTSKMMFSDDDMNGNNWKRIPGIEWVSAVECCKGYGGLESSGQSAAAAKKEKMIMAHYNNSCHQVPICQIDGCKMDLSSSKYYYQRHRVCEDHSKTSKAILHGVEHRFCQQCSRFHLLEEFDNDKRSCRKRLACHNNRRRKSRLYINWDASLLLEMASQGASSSFLIPKILYGDIINFCQENENKTSNNNNNINRHYGMLSSYDHAIPAAGNLVEMLSPPIQELSAGENYSGSAFSRRGSKKSNNCMNCRKKCLKASPRRSGRIIDLQQLSTHFRRVEQQRSQVMMKNQEIMSSNNNVLCCFTSI